LLITLVSVLTGNLRRARWTVAVALGSAAAALGWLFFVASGTVGYLQPAARLVLHNFTSFLAGGGGGAPAVSQGPLGISVLSLASTLIISALLPVGLWQTWRRHRRDPWMVAMAIGSVSWYALVAVRLVAAQGNELAGRGATFALIPVGYVAALAVVHLSGTAVRWQLHAAAATLPAVMVMLMLNGLASGWPPYWERLPGPHQVAGFDRSVGPEEIGAATWALSVLGPGHRFAADWGSYLVLGSYGDQAPITNISYLYTSPVAGKSDAWLALNQAVHYILVDSRLSQQLPAQGTYFPGAPAWGQSRPLAAAGLTKFNHIAGVDRVYDSGNIVIYDLTGWDNAP
jgi:hypothetical protein